MDILAVLLFGLFIYFVVFSPIRDIKNKVNFENARGAYTISFYKLEKKLISEIIILIWKMLRLFSQEKKKIDIQLNLS
ncbi:hypothetical protein [Streptococcus parauberis]|uniref:hypothetical protein n=1 Tax=Streptococcus parauberis TaxID=1348 RepID=UPI0039B03EC9